MRMILNDFSHRGGRSFLRRAGGGKKPRPPSYGHTRCGAGVRRPWARMPDHACAYALKEIADAVEHIIHSANTTEH
jgi:hypothetical protein